MRGAGSLVAMAALLLAADVAAQAGSGEDLYAAACATCHGTAGRGADRARVAFSEPLPDFADCAFATREPDADWLAVMHDGGPARAFARMMPAFGEALTIEQLERILAHVRLFCSDRSWPRGELNLPRPLVTEKAFPEDEAVVSSAFTVEGPADVASRAIYERRFGARNQFEIVVPFSVSHRPSASANVWVGGVGDIALGAKRAVFHDVGRGRIFSVAGEVLLPTGSAANGLGKGTAVAEPFLAYGQILPHDGFIQVQAGIEIPFDTARASREAFWRAAAGKSFSQARWGRTWSPMLELLAARELLEGVDTRWDIVPQVQVTLSTRQHVMFSAGLRVPLTNSGPRRTQALVYLLWDWFDGPLFGAW